MVLNRYHLLLTLSVVSLSTGAREDGPIETVTVVGTHSGLKVEQLSGQISIIDRDQIAALNKANVQGLLDSLAGVSVNQQGGAGGITSLYVRGGEANFAVVMINGIQVNNPTDTRGGSFDLSTLDSSQIERIELIRGPQSAVYGADALSGVLNIVTRGPAGESGIVLRAEGGTDGYYRAGVKFSGRLGDSIDYTAAVVRSDSGDVVEGSDRELNAFDGSIGYDVSDRSHLRASLRYSDSERAGFPEDSGGPEQAIWRDKDTGDSQDFALQLAWNSSYGEVWQYAVEARWYNLESKESSPGIFPGFEVPPTGADIDFDRYELSGLIRLVYSGVTISLGVDAEREEGDSDGYIDFGVQVPADFELDRDTYGSFAEVHYELADSLSLSGSVRYDDVDQVDSELTSRLGMLLRLSGDRTVVRANWGEGFKPPSFFALAHPLVGNPLLEPETATSWDVGVEQQLGESVSLNLVYFDNTYRDLIDFDDDLFLSVNRNRVQSSGVEMSFEAVLGLRGRLRGHATYLDVEVRGSDEELRGRPDWKAGLQWYVDFSDDVSATAEYLWVDEVTEASRHTGQSVDYTLEAYSTLDLSVNWRVNKSLTIEAAVSNVLDENFEQAVGFPSAGVFPRVAVEWTPDY